MASGAVSDPHTLVCARRLRAVSWLLEFAVLAVVVGSVAALASVHPWAYVPLGIGCIGIGLLVVLRTAAVRAMQRILGSQRLAFHISKRWITLDAEPSYAVGGWSFDLAQPAFPRAPLLLPGLVFLSWVAFQIIPLPAAVVSLLRAGALQPGRQSLTLSLPDTLRGFGFVAAALALHVAAAAVFAARESRERFRRALAVLGLLLALVTLIQVGSGSPLIYGIFKSLEAPEQVSFGPFVNRNHFAGYMLMVIPMCLALLAHAYRRYAQRTGEQTNLRRRLVTLATPEGTSFLYATLPVLATIGALIATTSRGALLAFVMSLALASLGLRKGEAPAWLLGIGLAAMSLSWFGLERVDARFVQTGDDAPGRTLVWKDSLTRMGGLWLTGSGFNTFGSAMSHVKLWELPTGASALPQPAAEAAAKELRFGVRVPADMPGYGWFREAHNDYVQVLVETGVPGLLIALWGVVATLRAARHDLWLVVALVAVLLHSLVDFDLQIPAVAVLFVVLAGMRAPPA